MIGAQVRSSSNPDEIVKKDFSRGSLKSSRKFGIGGVVVDLARDMVGTKNVKNPSEKNKAFPFVQLFISLFNY